jgi:hypothetical protein
VEEMEGKKKTYMHDMEQWGAAAAEVPKLSAFHENAVSRESLASGRRTVGSGKFAKSRLAVMMTLMVMMCVHVCVWVGAWD